MERSMWRRLEPHEARELAHDGDGEAIGLLVLELTRRLVEGVGLSVDRERGPTMPPPKDVPQGDTAGTAGAAVPSPAPAVPRDLAR